MNINKIDEYLAALYKSTRSTAIVDYFLDKYNFHMDCIIKKLFSKFKQTPFNLEDFSFFKYQAVIDALKYYHRSLKFSFLQSLLVIFRSKARYYFRVQINNRNKLLNYATSFNSNDDFYLKAPLYKSNSLQVSFREDSKNKQIIFNEALKMIRASNNVSQYETNLFIDYLNGQTLSVLSKKHNISTFKINNILVKIKKLLKEHFSVLEKK